MHVRARDQINQRSLPTDLPGCRFCAAPLRHTFVDLGMSPLCESYVPAERLDAMEPFYPLHVRVCEQCLLVQLEEYVRAEEIFTEYAYFSSYSDTWVEHARDYVEMAIERFGLDADEPRRRGRQQRRLPAAALRRARASRRSGIEPAANVAEAAREQGHRDARRFFGRELARTSWCAEGRRADLLRRQQRAGARPRPQRLRRRHSRSLLAPRGRGHDRVPAPAAADRGATSSTPSTTSTSRTSRCSPPQSVFAAHGLELFDVEELPTHGGSLRIYAQHADDRQPTRSSQRVHELRRSASARSASTRSRRIRAVRRAGRGDQVEPARVPDRQAREGKRIAGYGAPGQGQHAAQLLRHPHRLPRLHRRPQPVQAGPVPARARTSRSAHPEALEQDAPDYILILPWNLKDEIVAQLAYVREWGAQFIVPIPEVRGRCEGRALLRRPGHADARGIRGRAQADGPGRQPADPLARDEVLRPLRLQRLRAVPRLQGRGRSSSSSSPTTRRWPTTSCSSNGGAKVHLLKTDIHDWNITFVDTGLHASIGERLRAVRHLLARRRDVPRQLRRHADRRRPARDDRARQGRAARSAASSRSSRTTASTWSRWTTTAASARSSDVTRSDIWINGGYFVLRSELLDDLARARSSSRSRSSG